ncbi:haloacid dehalogenase-like hydrolase-domain-containing protein [Desarmillaria ectypa]|nr:haloacid dehalogenase-like hydrolase-domain-containing protein [Desarmillaria ectypa]
MSTVAAVPLTVVFAGTKSLVVRVQRLRPQVRPNLSRSALTTAVLTVAALHNLLEPEIPLNQPAQEADQPCSCCSGDDNIDDKPVATSKVESIALQTLSIRSKTSGRESCCGSPVRRGRRSRFLWKKKRVPCCSGADEQRARQTNIADSSPEGQDGQEKVLTLMITGMDCPVCSPRVERALKILGVGDIKVHSSLYVSGSTDPEAIRRKVESATGFPCPIASLRNGQRTLREILKLSKTDFRFTIHSSARYPTACEIHAALLDQGWVVSPVNEDDDEAAIDEAATLDFRRSISLRPFHIHSSWWGFASLIQIFCAGYIIVVAGHAVILYHHLDADVLITLYLPSLRFSIPFFFETGALLITLILSRLISVYVRNTARRSSTGLTPPPVEVSHWFDPRAVEGVRDIHTALLDVGDTVVVHAGETVPIDETVQDNSLEELRPLTTEARSSRARIQDTADRIAQRIIPIVLGVASIAFLVWALVIKYGRHESSGKAVADDLSYAVAVLALSCPCALTLCVPLVILYARIASQKPPFSLIFRSSAALQHARIATHVIIDKTGTLTTGKMRVVEAVFNKDDGTGVSEGLIKALVAGSEHPVSAAIARYLAAGSALSEDLDDVQTVVGKGIQANIVRGGSVSWCAIQDVDCVGNMLDTGKSVFAVTIDDVFLAAFGLENDLQPESTDVASSLVARGILVSNLSDNHQKAVDGVCPQLGVKGVQAKGSCLPEDKRDIVRMTSWSASCAQDDAEFGNDGGNNRTRTQERLRQRNIVVFVGDGSNDTRPS